MVAAGFTFARDTFSFEVTLDERDHPSFVGAWQALLAYVGVNLLRAEPDQVRDRISRLLVDETYHSLFVAVIQAMREPAGAASASQPFEVNVPDEVKPRLLIAKQLQARMAEVAARVRVTATTSASAETAEARVKAVRESLTAPIPTIAKRGILGGYIATICNLGLSANSSVQAPAATLSVVVDQLVEALRRQLAFALAFELVTDVGEELVPTDYRFSPREETASYFEGLARSQRKAVGSNP